jgi:ubiquinone/menaquinone biosynthesis C-methylase UbiE
MFSDPKTIIAQLHIELGAQVADLGAGTGAFVMLLSGIVGPGGKVYACEVQKDIITRLENELREKNITNVQTVWSDIEKHQGTKLRDQSIDWVIIANVLFQIEDKQNFLKEVSRILRPNGSVLLVDWAESFGNLGPHPNDVVQKDRALQLFSEAGLRPTPQVIEAGSHHYGIIFKK